MIFGKVPRPKNWSKYVIIPPLSDILLGIPSM